MQQVSWRESDYFTITSYGNGLSYTIKNDDGREFFLQGDDAAEWREQYNDYCRAIEGDENMQESLDTWMSDCMNDYSSAN